MIATDTEEILNQVQDMVQYDIVNFAKALNIYARADNFAAA